MVTGMPLGLGRRVGPAGHRGRMLGRIQVPLRPDKPLTRWSAERVPGSAPRDSPWL